MRGYGDLRGDRLAEITTQLGFPTAYFSAVIDLHPARNARTLELIALAQGFAATVAMRCKHALACPRPGSYSVQIQPMIVTPGHGALPAAHAVEAFIVAEVIKHLVDPGAQNMDLRRMLDRAAAWISVNRTVVGVHFPADSLSGAMLGQTLGEYFCARAGAGTPVQAATFDGPGVGSEDFSLGTLMELSGDDWRRKSGARIALAPVVAAPEAAPALSWLWQAARREWTGVV